MSDVADAEDVNENPDAGADANGDGEAQDDAPKSGKKKLIIIAAGALLLLGGGGGAAWYLGLFGGGGGDGEVAAVSEAVFYPLPEMTVNLASTGGRAQYLKVRISLELSDRAVLKAIPPVEPRIMDAFQVHLRELRESDLEGSMGIYRLKEELLRRVNLAVHPFQVDRVLFNEMLIQ